MNIVALTGRFTKDATFNEAGTVANANLAVPRRRKVAEGEPNADFVPLKFLNERNIDFVRKYGKKGVKFDITGSIDTGSFTNKDGQRVYTWGVIVKEIDFGESKSAASGGESGDSDDSKGKDEEFTPVPEDVEEPLPFN